MPTKNPLLMLMTIAALSLVVAPRRAAADCVSWPQINPVWNVCWIPPEASSGISGSGLELQNVTYRGKKVLHRAHLPILNVLYDDRPGACGGATRTYRDWQNQPSYFAAGDVLRTPRTEGPRCQQSGYAEPASSLVAPLTTCEQPGLDRGTFCGVAAEKQADRLVLTTQLRAGWYRYIQKWIFLLDGTIQTRLGFAFENNPCVSKWHTHHAYFRLDFDIDGSNGDKVDEYNMPPLVGDAPWHGKTSEIARKRDYDRQRRWRVLDKTSGRGYEIVPDAADGVADGFGGADLWVLRYHGGEIDDGGASSSAGALRDAAHLDRFVSGEGVDGEDVVLWYHAQARHELHTGDPVGACHYVGATLKPIGTW